MSDEHLRSEFQKQRERDAANAPPFASMWRARTKRTSPWWVAVPVVPLAAAAAFALWLVRSSNETRSVAHVTVTARVTAVDTEPLAFLLDSPTLTRMPDFDSSPIAKNK